MSADSKIKLNRRHFVAGAAVALGAGAMPALAMEGSTEILPSASGSVRNNASSFRMLDWQQYFDNTRGGAILVDLTSRALHFWSEDQSVYRLSNLCAALGGFDPPRQNRSGAKGRGTAMAPHGFDEGTQSRLARSGSRRCAGQPAWDPRAVSVLDLLPHPRHP